MNKVFLLSFLLVGCVNSSSVPVECPNTGNMVVNPEPNQFQKAKKVFSGGAQLVYNKSKNVYEWVTSEETKDKAVEFVDETKDKAGELVEQAKSKAQELVN